MPDMKRRRASTGREKNRNDHDPGQTAALDPPGPRRPARGRDPQPDGIHGIVDERRDRIRGNAPNAHACSRPPDSPAEKELGGYDWTPICFPVDYGRGQITTLDFIAGHDDLVLFGPPGTGKTHLAIALGRNACRKGIPARYFTAAGLVMRLLRAQSDNRLRPGTRRDRQYPAARHRQLGDVPIDEDGAGSCSRSSPTRYETQSIDWQHHQHRVQRMGQDLRRPQHGRRDHRPHCRPRTDDPLRGDWCKTHALMQ